MFNSLKKIPGKSANDQVPTTPLLKREEEGFDEFDLDDLDDLEVLTPVRKQSTRITSSDYSEIVRKLKDSDIGDDDFTSPSNVKIRPGAYYGFQRSSPTKNRVISVYIPDALPYVDKEEFLKKLSNSDKIQFKVLDERSLKKTKAGVIISALTIADTKGESGTKVYPNANFGTIIVFTDKEPEQFTHEVEIPSAATTPIRRCKSPPPDAKKSQTVVMTPSKVGKRTGPKSRCQSMHMLRDIFPRTLKQSVSAASYIPEIAVLQKISIESDEETGEPCIVIKDTDIKINYEILHLICFEILNKMAQKEENFVYGTAWDNTKMIPFEQPIKPMAKRLQKHGIELTLEVCSETYPKTQMAKKIIMEYQFKVSDKLKPMKVPFEFDCTVLNRPNRDVKRVIDILMSCMYNRLRKLKKVYEDSSLEEVNKENNSNATNSLTL